MPHAACLLCCLVNSQALKERTARLLHAALERNINLRLLPLPVCLLRHLAGLEAECRAPVGPRRPCDDRHRARRNHERRGALTRLLERGAAASNYVAGKQAAGRRSKLARKRVRALPRPT